MDPLTHALLGGAAAQAVGHRHLPRSAWAIGLLAGAAPDLDVLIRPVADPLGGLLWHRHFTHALLFVPIGAAIVTGLSASIPSLRGRLGAVFVAAAAAMATHGLCDALTSYGTLLYWPFSDRRVQWDILPIIDPLVTVPLALTLAIAIVAGWPRRREGTEPSAASRAGSRWAIAGLLVVATYSLFAARQEGLVRDAAMRLAAARGHGIIRVRAMPQPLSVLLWRTIYEFESYDGPAPVRWMQADLVRLPIGRATPERIRVRTGSSAPLRGRKELLAEFDGEGPDVLAAIAGFDWFTDGWTVSSPDDPRVLNDGRYAPLPESFRTLWGLVLPRSAEATTADRWGFRFDVGLRRSTLAALIAALRGEDLLLRPLDAAVEEARNGDPFLPRG